MMRGNSYRRWLWPLLGLALLVILAALFQPTLSSPAFSSPEDAAEVSARSAMIMSDADSSEAESAASSAEDWDPAPDVTELVQAPSSGNCIACHTNEALLQQLAEEPEEVVSELAEGEG